MPRVLMLKDEDPRSRVETIDDDQLPQRAVSVAIDYSDLNYKDALAVSGQAKVVRDYPFVPGIDLAGSVRESSDERYRPGDKVIISDMSRWDGHDRVRVD